ncbi:MAG: hypothetical protein KAX49_16885 [Halanaerobiales bacterium]|nr:hypothetical protein [Halanaerobiales bacterium]
MGHLEQKQRYVFDEIASFEEDDFFDFFVDQNSIAKDKGFSFEEFKKTFYGKYKPLLINVLLKKILEELCN